jgi:formylglycine-generating enzyme required for sulfatase activity
MNKTLAALRLLLLVLGFVSDTPIASGQFTAYFDYVRGGTNTHPFATVMPAIVANGSFTTQLTNIATGISTPVTLMVTNLNAAAGGPFPGFNANPAPGTLAYTNFHGYVDFDTNSIELVANANPALDPVSVLVLTGLDSNKTYNFSGTAIRGNAPYTDRWSLFELIETDGFLNAHTLNCLTTVQVPAIQTNQVAINTGVNNTAGTGDMAVWNGIKPGADRRIVIYSRHYKGTVPGGSSGGSKGYGMIGFRLQEIGSPPPPPSITTQPANMFPHEGETVMFNAVMQSSAALTYQWYFNGTNLVGANSDTLTIPNAQVSNAGSYWVIAANAYGSVTSQVATLIINMLRLSLQAGTNTPVLLVEGVPGVGALFVYGTTNALSFEENPFFPFLLMQTNTPSTNSLTLPVSPAGALSNQAFFSAVHLPGRSIDEFGDPEYAPDEPSPDMILFASGMPSALANGQSFLVDFFVTDTSGQVLDISGPVSIQLVRDSDGALHPDAQIAPSTGQLTNGHFRIQVTIQASTSLDGYTLGLELASENALGLFGPKLLAFPAAPSPLPRRLRTVFGLDPQTLEARRIAAADPNPAWSYPLRGANYSIAGTFGEWRGDNNTKVHKGVDLAASANINVIASRGGIISHHGHLLTPAQGDYLVIDHGDGWFSRYLHLQGSSIAVKKGDAIARGATVATNLYSRIGWGTHLHFEIRKDVNHSQWQEPFPGKSQDPLQIGTINPGSAIFSVPLGDRPPELEEFGLTRRHPGQNAFDKASMAITETTGPVYVYARFLDRESKTPGSDCDSSYYRLGLRAIGLQPENVVTNNWVWPSNEVAIANYLPAGSGNEKGFARYKIPPQPQRCGYYRYWWKWDTSIYTNATGPRSIVLTGVDHGGATSNYTFTFGPHIKSNLLTQVTPQQYRFTNVACLGATTPGALGNSALFVQPDQYKLEIIQANGQPLGGVIWSGPMAGGYTRLFTIHTNEEVYTFTLPDATSPDGLKLRVSSRLAPDIAHEICLCGGPDMAYIPAGPFVMGDVLNDYPGSGEQPTHTVQVSAFCMDKHEVTKALWDDVYTWAIARGYSFDYVGSGKAASHPVQTIDWYDCVKWCNARSEKEGRTPAYYTSAAQTTVYRSGQVTVDNSWVKWNAGYRLPTEAEWEKAARGGAGGHRFPWADTDTITHSQANYYSDSYYAYDVSPTRGYHPTYATGGFPYTSPVGSFAPNGYGLYDTAGNVWEWCSDWTGGYSSGSQIDPRGPASGSYRVIRGGGWGYDALNCRSAGRLYGSPDNRLFYIGFRSVLPPGQP